MNMKKILIIILFILISLTIIPHAHAQMMMNSSDTSSVNPTDIKQQQQDEATGKKLFEQFQNNQMTCGKLTDSDFEKIGEYSMRQMFSGNTAQHVVMNERIKQMRGTTGEEQMHTQIGKSVTSCASLQSNYTNGGVSHMMGFGGYGSQGMMNGNFEWFGAFAMIGWLILLIDLILAGIWLWQQIRSNKRK
jgi:hypothetical protein